MGRCADRSINMWETSGTFEQVCGQVYGSEAAGKGDLEVREKPEGRAEEVGGPVKKLVR